jgi:CDP-diacylglycerol--glycerol-3-phosphate 3-phosphatidyltransferase
MIDGRRGRETAQAGVVEADVGDAAAAEPAPPAVASPAAAGNGLGARLHRLGVTADQATIAGLVLAVCTAVVIGAGYLYVGVALGVTGGLMDALDGSIAKAAGTSTKRGAFFDSVADRVSDGIVMGGVCWYLASGSDPRLALLPFAILAVGNVISYTRAKAESLGYSAKGGLMERAERLIGVGIALLFHAALVPILWIVLGLSVMTAVQRFVKVWRQATAEVVPSPAVAGVADTAPSPAVAALVRPGWRAGKVESRWRAWREARLQGGGHRSSAPRRRWRARQRPFALSARAHRGDAADARTARRARVGGSGRVDRWARRRRSSSLRGFRRRFESES